MTKKLNEIFQSKLNEIFQSKWLTFAEEDQEIYYNDYDVPVGRLHLKAKKNWEKYLESLSDGERCFIVWDDYEEYSCLPDFLCIANPVGDGGEILLRKDFAEIILVLGDLP